MAMYTQRFYRSFACSERWTTFRVQVKSSDLYIRSQDNQALRVQHLVRRLRLELEDHIARQPGFLHSLEPVPRLRKAPPIVQRMYRAAELAQTGPMAAVAGAIAEFVGRDLLSLSEEVIVENGGDTFLGLQEPCTITIFAGKSVFSGKIGLLVQPEQTPLAVCTSSGTVGHSFSSGQADAVTVVSQDTCLADAAATAIANLISAEGDLEAALDWAMGIPGVLGAVLIIKDSLAARGEVELVKTESSAQKAKHSCPHE